MLLTHGIDLADRDGAKTYLEASKEGLGLYLSLGFEQVGDFGIDLKVHGGKEAVVVPCLVRKPKQIVP